MVDSTNPMNLAMPPKLDPEVKPAKIPRLGADEKMAGIIASSLPAAPAVTGKGIPDPLDLVAANDKAVAARKELEDGTSFVRTAQAAASTQTFLMAAVRNQRVEELAGTPDPMFKVDPKLLGNMTEEDQNFLLRSVNQTDFDRRSMELADWHSEEEVLMRNGAGTALLAGFMAGLPEGMASGALVAKGFQVAGAGARVLAAQGKRGAAIASTLAENVGGNLAMTGAQDYIDTHVGGSDYVMGAVFGVIGAGVETHSLMEAARLADVRSNLARVQDAAADRAYALHAQAEKNLGEGATPEQVKAEASRIESQDLRDALNPGVDLPSDRHILPPEDTAIRPDVPEETPAKGQNGTTKAPEEAAPAITPAVEHAAPTALPVLPKELAGALPKWKTYDINFASDVDKALYIVSQSKKSKADVKYRGWLTEQGLTDQDITKYSKILRENLKVAESEIGASADVLSARGWDKTEAIPRTQYTSLSDAQSRMTSSISPETGKSTVSPTYESPWTNIERARMAKESPVFMQRVSDMTGGQFKGVTAEVEALPVGKVHVTAGAAGDVILKPVQAALQTLMRMLPADHKVILSNAQLGAEHGAIVSAGKVHFISISTKGLVGASQAIRTAIHEMGHAVYHAHGAKIPAPTLAKINSYYLEFLNKLEARNPEAAQMRLSITHVSADNKSMKPTAYSANKDEMFAEQMVKWAETRAMQDKSPLPAEGSN